MGCLLPARADRSIDELCGNPRSMLPRQLRQRTARDDALTTTKPVRIIQGRSISSAFLYLHARHLPWDSAAGRWGWTSNERIRAIPGKGLAIGLWKEWVQHKKDERLGGWSTDEPQGRDEPYLLADSSVYRKSCIH